MHLIIFKTASITAVRGGGGESVEQCTSRCAVTSSVWGGGARIVPHAGQAALTPQLSYFAFSAVRVASWPRCDTTLSPSAARTSAGTRSA